MQQITNEIVLAELAHHRGQAKGIHVKDLVMHITGQLATSDAQARAVRKAVADLRMDGQPICAHPTYGYFMAETHAELSHTRNFLRARAMTSIKAYNRLKRAIGLNQLLGLPAQTQSTTTNEEESHDYH